MITNLKQLPYHWGSNRGSLAEFVPDPAALFGENTLHYHFQNELTRRKFLAVGTAGIGLATCSPMQVSAAPVAGQILCGFMKTISTIKYAEWLKWTFKNVIEGIIAAYAPTFLVRIANFIKMVATEIAKSLSLLADKLEEWKNELVVGGKVIRAPEFHRFHNDNVGEYNEGITGCFPQQRAESHGLEVGIDKIMYPRGFNAVEFEALEKNGRGGRVLDVLPDNWRLKFDPSKTTHRKRFDQIATEHGVDLIMEDVQYMYTLRGPGRRRYVGFNVSKGPESERNQFLISQLD